MNRLGAGCVQLLIRFAEPPGEHRYENRNNNNIFFVKSSDEMETYADPGLKTLLINLFKVPFSRSDNNNTLSLKGQK